MHVYNRAGTGLILNTHLCWSYLYVSKWRREHFFPWKMLILYLSSCFHHLYIKWILFIKLLSKLHVITERSVFCFCARVCLCVFYFFFIFVGTYWPGNYSLPEVESVTAAWAQDISYQILNNFFLLLILLLIRGEKKQLYKCYPSTLKKKEKKFHPPSPPIKLIPFSHQNHSRSKNLKKMIILSSFSFLQMKTYLLLAVVSWS